MGIGNTPWLAFICLIKSEFVNRIKNRQIKLNQRSYDIESIGKKIIHRYIFKRQTHEFEQAFHIMKAAHF